VTPAIIGQLVANPNGETCKRCGALPGFFFNRDGITVCSQCPPGLKVCGCSDEKSCAAHTCDVCGAPDDECLGHDDDRPEVCDGCGCSSCQCDAKYDAWKDRETGADRP
jgi:hypothetical protein